MWVLFRTIVFCLAGCLASNVYAKEIRLHVPVLSESPRLHLFFHELLESAIRETGHSVELVARELPQMRAKAELEAGRLSLYWMLETEQRNQKHIPIHVGLTNNLIGKRILLIRKKDQALFDSVKSLQDFRALGLVGGMGTDWYDARVWKANDLKYKEHSGDWRAIFRMIPLGRSYDYFSRGLTEIREEAVRYTDLAIEQTLVLEYQRDFKFYLSRQGPNAGQQHVALLNQAMKQARASGLIDRLVKKHWADDFEALRYHARKKIMLNSPFE